MYEGLSDEEAVGRAKDGDSTSYGILAARYQKRLQRVAQRVLRNEADAEDAVQDAHLLALKHLGAFAGRSTFYCWMTSITINEALTQIRRRKGVVAAGDDHLDVTPSPTRNPEQQAIDSNFGDVLSAAVGRLPEPYRAVFQLRELEHLSTTETGERLGLTPACVKTRLLRAKALMRKSLSHVAPDREGAQSRLPGRFSHRGAARNGTCPQIAVAA